MQDTVIKRAKNYYENCELIIKELCSVTKDTEYEIDEDSAVTEFDVMMLALLFSQAIADDDFCENEKDFIKSFPNADNFFLFFDDPDKQALTWDKVFEMSADDQKDLSETLNELLNNTGNSFALRFAILDALTTESYIAEISINLSQIGLLLSMVDGDITSDELTTFHEYTQELIIGKWAYYARSFQDAMNVDKEDDSVTDDAANTEE